MEESPARTALRTPRAAAIAGIVFSVLTATSMVLFRLAVPASLSQASAWAHDPLSRSSVAVALALIPFAGIAFLWFIGVVRARMGAQEDRFFASVFLGSGLLFVGLLFISSALAGGLLAAIADAASSNSVQTLQVSQVWQFGHEVTYEVLTIYAMRMAAVFILSTATISLQIGMMPRWIILLGYVCALLLLITSGYVAWVELVFPAWVFVVSTYILIATLRSPAREPP